MSINSNPPKDDAQRNGAVKDRGAWTVKRDSSTGQFMAVKMDGTPFKGVRKEKAMDVIRKLKDK